MENEHVPGEPRTEVSAPWRTGDFIGIILAAFIVVPFLVFGVFDVLKGARALPSWPSGATLLVALYAQELTLYVVTVGSVIKGYGASLRSIGIFTPRWLWHWTWGLFLGGPALIILEQVAGILARALAVVLLGKDQVAVLLTQENAAFRELVWPSAPWWGMLGFLVLVIVVAPLAEEIFFRGFGYALLRQRWGTGVALTATTIVFTLIHGYTIQFIPILLVSAGLGWIREKRGAVEASWGAHLALNFWASWQMLMMR